MNALAKIDAGSSNRDDPSKKKLVLLIEDERTQRMVLRAALERDGFLVDIRVCRHLTQFIPISSLSTSACPSWMVLLRARHCAGAPAETACPS